MNSLCYNLPYYAKSLEKYAPILPWLKFKHGHPWKTLQCDNIFGPLVLCFHLPQMWQSTKKYKILLRFGHKSLRYTHKVHMLNLQLSKNNKLFKNLHRFAKDH